MLEIRSILVVMCWVTFVKCKMEPFIVGGHVANIQVFPHSVFMFVKCFEGINPESFCWICGGSILNEKLILTAAHCIYGCSYKSSFTVSMGHRHLKKGFVSSVRNYLVHEKYSSITTSNDIALLKLKTDIQFGMNVKRIALMQQPPYYEKAQIAGWGMTNEVTQSVGMYLKYINQWVWKLDSCKQVINQVHEGTLCASSGDTNAYSSRGDSGSALVVRGYIQIGIVSYKMPSISRSLVVYTDTGYFYDWIRKNSKKLYCVIEQT